MSEMPKSDIRLLIEGLRDDANEYFQRLDREIEKNVDDYWTKRQNADFFWRQVSEESFQIARTLSERLIRYTAQVAAAMRNAPLVGSEDIADLREAAKTMRDALRLRHYRLHDVEVINDEDRILGVRPARQTDNESLSPLEADALFYEYATKVLRTLKLIEASADLSPPGIESPTAISAPRYRPGTAFIMMWMDPTHPELIDIADAVKAVFLQFGINAVRADDIEHEGQITQRVLNELRTAEFLFADLTGARPNVYYEVGFAHALGRRVVLYRQAGTGLHFDLAGYNCPEYTNLRDLREKLQKRLESMTNRNAQRDDGCD